MASGVQSNKCTHQNTIMKCTLLDIYMTIKRTQEVDENICQLQAY